MSPIAAWGEGRGVLSSQHSGSCTPRRPWNILTSHSSSKDTTWAARRSPIRFWRAEAHGTFCSAGRDGSQDRKGPDMTWRRDAVRQRPRSAETSGPILGIENWWGAPAKDGPEPQRRWRCIAPSLALHPSLSIPRSPLLSLSLLCLDQWRASLDFLARWSREPL